MSCLSVGRGALGCTHSLCPEPRFSCLWGWDCRWPCTPSGCFPPIAASHPAFHCSPGARRGRKPPPEPKLTGRPQGPSTEERSLPCGFPAVLLRHLGATGPTPTCSKALSSAQPALNVSPYTWDRKGKDELIFLFFLFQKTSFTCRRSDAFLFLSLPEGALSFRRMGAFGETLA